MGFFSIITLIGAIVALFVSMLIKELPIMILGIFLMFISVLLPYYLQQDYVEIKRIDSSKYIQCIESQQYIVSTGSRGAAALTTMLDANGKPIKCSNIIYTQEQTWLPINKDKNFIVKE